MTSNMGSHLIQEAFSKAMDEQGSLPEQVVERVQTDVLEMLKMQLKPEFLNRIDEIVMFEPLSKADIEKIVDLQMNALKAMLSHNGLTLDYTEAARAFIATAGYDAMYGARPVKRVIQREVVGELSKRILAGAISRDKAIVIDAENGALKITN